MTIETKRAIRQLVIDSGVKRSIRKKGSYNVAGATRSTPIEVVEGYIAPVLCGQPYLSTTFRRGAFTKNLYTPSSLRIEVGSKWLAENFSEA